MHEACKAAGIETLTFHELRHSYGSLLVNAGCPLAYVAAQLGHTDTRMVEKHRHGHLNPLPWLIPSAPSCPSWGLMAAPKVAALKIGGGA